jgi:hypothetical protein
MDNISAQSLDLSKQLAEVPARLTLTVVLS